MTWLRGKTETPGARRAASALLFCAAAAALALFPEGAAGGVLPGFAPAQVPAVGETPDYDDPALCEQLGGNVEITANGENVCSGMDRNDTFCIVGAAEALPCRGLFKHVIKCNADYNRPALNPFFCGARCDAPSNKARGPQCERIVDAQAFAAHSLPATVYAAEGYAGVGGIVEVTAGYTLDFAPGGTVFAVSESSGDYVIKPRPPGLRSLATLQLTAELVCGDCYPLSSLTIAAVFIPVAAPPQSVFAMTLGAALPAGVTFSLPSLEDYPGLSNTAFVDADSGDEFAIDAAGHVSGIPASGFAATRVLRGYWTADGMLGTLVAALTLEESAEDVEDAKTLEAALPPSARVISVNAPSGYAGLAGRIVSHRTEASLLFLPETKGGISLAADGGVYPATPLDRALRAEFGVTATLRTGLRFFRASVLVEILPLDEIPAVVVNARVGDDFSGVSLLAEEVIPAHPALLRGATLRIPAGAELPDGFTRTADDDIAGPVSLAAGVYDIPYEVSGPAFVGEIGGVLRLAGHVAAPAGLAFAGMTLTRRLEAAPNLRDASGQQFNAVYWGRRRGLHYMAAPLGNVRIAEEPLSPGAAPDFETEKRRDPLRADSPDTRWSLADYAAFCGAGGDSGLSGRIWRLPTIGEVAALTYPGKNQDADSLRLPRRLIKAGIPGLVPSSDLRIPLPANDGRDTWDPLPFGLLGAVNAGAPIVPGNDAGNTPTEGRLWSAGIGRGGYGAFFPWEKRISDEGTRYFRGATGYAACVVEAEEDYQQQPKLAVMEFSYAGKAKRCQISASPTEHCNEAGDFRSAGFVDSSFNDESALAITVSLAMVSLSSASAERVLKMVTLRALHFGGVDGEAAISSLPGEATLAAVSQFGYGALTMVLTSTDENSAVYAVSLRAEATLAGLHRAVFSARPRVGREALLEVVAAVLNPFVPGAPKPADDTPPDTSGYRVVEVGPNYSGPLMTVDGAVRVNPNPTLAAQNGLTLAAESGVVGLPSPLARSVAGVDVGYTLAAGGTARIAEIHPDAGYLEVLVSLAGGEETTLQAAALRREYPTMRVELGIVQSSVLATLPAPGRGAYADADESDDFVIKANGEIHLGDGQRAAFLAYHRRITLTANIVSENGRGLFRVVEIAANGAEARLSPPAEGVHFVRPLVPRPNSDFSLTLLGDSIGVTIARRIPLFIRGQRFVLAPDYAGPAGATFPDDLPRGHSARFGACAPDAGVSVAPDGGDLTVDGAAITAAYLFFSCPLLLPFERPSDMLMAAAVGLVQERFSISPTERSETPMEWYADKNPAPLPHKYYERLFVAFPPPPAPTQVEVIRIPRSTVAATVMFKVYQDVVSRNGAPLSEGDSLTGADTAGLNAVVAAGAAVAMPRERAAVWRYLGAELQYGTISGRDAEDFEVSADGRLSVVKYPALGARMLTLFATADGLLGTLSVSVAALAVPTRRVWRTVVNVDGTGVFDSLPVASGRRVEAGALAARTLAENGLRGAMSTDGASFEISALAPLECLRTTFVLNVYDADGEAPAELWEVDLSAGGVGAACSLIPAAPTWRLDRVAYFASGMAGAAWSGALPSLVTAAAQVEAPDMSALGLTLKFSEGKTVIQNPVFRDGKLVEGEFGLSMTVGAVSVTVEILPSHELGFDERRHADFIATIYRGDSRRPEDVLALWDVLLELRSANEYNLLFLGTAAEGQEAWLQHVNAPGFGYLAISLQSAAEQFSPGFWRAPSYYAQPGDGSNQYVTSENIPPNNTPPPRRWHGRFVARGDSPIVPDELYQHATSNVPFDRILGFGLTPIDITPNFQVALRQSNLNNVRKFSLGIRTRNNWSFDNPTQGVVRVTVYSAAPGQPPGTSKPTEFVPEEVINIYYAVAPPERMRHFHVKGEAVGSHVVSGGAAYEGPAGPVYAAEFGDEIDPPSGRVLAEMAEQGLTAEVDNTVSPPTFQFGVAPNFGEAGRTSTMMPGPIRVTVWDTPRGAIPAQIWEFEDIEFSYPEE